jgi:O-antigen ligase
VFLASAAAFLFVTPFPSSAGWRVFFLVCALAALLRQAWRREQPLELARVPRLLALAAGAWIALCIASLAWSIDPGYTLAELRRETLYGGMAFVVFFAGTRTPGHLHLWVKTLFAGALVLGIDEWLHFLMPAAQWARSVSMGPGPFSTHVVMLAPLLVLFVARPPTGMRASVASALALGAALVAGGIAGDSRILWVALLVAAVVAFAVFWSQTPAQHPSRTAARRALLLALAALPLLMAISWDYKLRYYPHAASTLESLSFDERPLIWSVAARDAAERPWAGHGYGREIVGARLREQLTRAGLSNAYFHGHNVFLDAALQLGVFGVAAFTLFMAALAGAFMGARKRAGGAPLAIAALAMLAGSLTKDLTDDFFFRPNSLVFWAIAGMLLGLAARLPEKS